MSPGCAGAALQLPSLTEHTMGLPRIPLKMPFIPLEFSEIRKGEEEDMGGQGCYERPCLLPWEIR